MRDNITVTDSVLRHFRNVVFGTAAANLLAWAVGAPWTLLGPIAALIIGLLWGFLIWTGMMVVAGKFTINNVHKHAELTMVEPGAHRIDLSFLTACPHLLGGGVGELNVTLDKGWGTAPRHR